MCLHPLPRVGEGWGERSEGLGMLDNAKVLRSNQTEAEQRLWVSPTGASFHGFEVQAAKADRLLEHRLIIEVDGGQHAEQVAYDQSRDAWLRSQGYTVLRFWNNEVMHQLEDVLEQIRNTISLSPSPSPTRGRGE